MIRVLRLLRAIQCGIFDIMSHNLLNIDLRISLLSKLMEIIKYFKTSCRNFFSRVVLFKK